MTASHPRAAFAPRIIALALAAFGAAALPRPAAAQPADASAGAHAAPIEQARELLRRLVSDDTLPGLSVAVGINGEIVWAEGFGWANVEQRQPVTASTLFRVGSTGKPMTAAAVGLLHERGKLNLDEPVRTYVPEFPEKPWPITTRQLLGHLGGIRDYRGPADYLVSRHCDDVRDGFYAFGEDTLVAAPGTRFTYTSYGYALASAAVQAAAGEPYAEFMRREIFAPLGMTSTAPETASSPAPHRAALYVRNPGLTPAPYDDDSCVLGGGGFVSTPSDLVRFGFGMLNGKILAPQTVQMLWTPQRLDSGESTGYGMGWFVRQAQLGSDAPAVRLFGHGGTSAGADTSFMVFPDQGMVVAVVGNVYQARVAPIAARVAQLFQPAAQP